MPAYQCPDETGMGNRCPENGNAPDRDERTEAREESGWASRRGDYTTPPVVWRRRPPYAGRLAEILSRPETWRRLSGTSADGQHLTLWVLAGPDAWQVAREWLSPPEVRALFVAAPPGEDPAGFDWRILAGHPPIMLRSCGELPQGDIAFLVAALLRDGAGRVLAPGGRLYVAGEVRHG